MEPQYTHINEDGAEIVRLSQKVHAIKRLTEKDRKQAEDVLRTRDIIEIWRETPTCKTFIVQLSQNAQIISDEECAIDLMFGYNGLNKKLSNKLSSIAATIVKMRMNNQTTIEAEKCFCACQ